MSKEACENFMFGNEGIMLLIGDGHYARALDLINSQGHLYPEIAKMLYTLQIALAANLGDIPQALHVMENALAAGAYFPAMAFDENADPPGYAILYGNPTFERLKKSHQAHYQEAIAKIAPVANRIPPDRAVAAPPLLIAFHGNTSYIAQEVDYYRHASTLGWLLSQPQSVQSWTAWGYVWGDMEVTEQQVRSDWARLQQQESFDPTRLVTAGISKGGEIALWSILTGIIPACGFVAIAPGGPLITQVDRLRSMLQPKKDSGLRGYLMVGDQDRGLELTKQLASILRAEGFECELDICPSVGHWFPDDFHQRLEKALRFVAPQG